MSNALPEFLKQLPLGRYVTVITVDANGLAALAKPAGVLYHPNSPGEEKRSLLQASYDMEGEFYNWTDPQGSHRIWLLNRLDSATSGVILLCKNDELAGVMKEHFRRKRIRKVYNAMVFGKAPTGMQLWRDRLEIQKQAGRIRTTTRGHIPCESRMTLLRGWGSLSLIRLEPVTGRSHQLRVQCAKRNLPIVGDATYGDFARNRDFQRSMGNNRLFLHSLETTFDYEFHGQRTFFSAVAPLPVEFESRR